jgi:ABC-type branched-subunit amino acid transport system substrate-binding protein
MRVSKVTALAVSMTLVAVACGDGADGDDDTPDVGATAATPTDGDGTEPDGGDHPLRIGYVLPETGPGAFFGPATIGAVELAVQDINEAGGVLGQDATVDGGDEGERDAGTAQQTVDRLLEGGVDWIVGAASSGVSLTIIDRVTGAGVGQCSPSNTSPTFTGYDDNGLYFRTVASDALQGQVVGERVVNDGHSTVAILARADDFGTGLADVTEEAVTASGAEVVEKIIYDTTAASYDAEVGQVAAASPDAVVVIGFTEVAQILAAMIQRGIGPGDIAVYAPEQRTETIGQDVDPNDPGVVAGLRGTAATASEDSDFIDRLLEFRDIEETLFAAQAYDCVIVAALAAVAAGSTDAETFKDEVAPVTTGGTECTGFAECLELLEAGEDIDYQGAAGPLEFSDAGEPTVGTYEVWEVDADGEFTTLDRVTISAE